MDTAIQQVREMIFTVFRSSNAGVGHAVNGKAVYIACAGKPALIQALDPAVTELVSEGVLEPRAGTHFMTEKGLDVIYPESDAEASLWVQEDVLSFLRNAGITAGKVMNQRAFQLTHYVRYNPKQKRVLEDAVQALVNAGILEARDGSGVFVTAKGQDHLYG